MTKVDIELLTNVAGTIRAKNQHLDNEFAIPRNAASKMDSAWSGSVATNAMQAFYKLEDYNARRYTVLENFAKELVSMASGYTATENQNTSLADKFK